MIRKHRKYINLICNILRIIIGLIFIIASIDKIAAPKLFLNNLLKYKIVYGDIASLLSIILPWIELLIGILLILNYMPRFSLSAAAFMTVMFIGALSIVAIRGDVIDCGCFGSISSVIKEKPVDAIIRDIIILIMISTSFVCEIKKRNAN